MNNQRIISYEDIGYNQFFEKKLEDIGMRRKGIEKIPIEALPELSPPDVRRIIEQIPVEILPRLSAADVSHLIEAMPPELIEKKLFESENRRLVIDLETGQFILKDDKTNRILFDGKTGEFKISDAGYDVLTATTTNLSFYFDPKTGDLKLKGAPVNTSAELFSHLSIEHFWTGSASWDTRTGCNFAINGDNFENQAVYYECVMANEKANRTAYTRIHNITDSKPVVGSEISTTIYPLNNLTRVRSEKIYFPSGLHEYQLQIRMNQTGGGGNNAHFYAARLVITQEYTLVI